jgi:hypothetical protein
MVWFLSKKKKKKKKRIIVWFALKKKKNKNKGEGNTAFIEEGRENRTARTSGKP